MKHKIKYNSFDLYDEDCPGNLTVSVKDLKDWIDSLPKDGLIEVSVHTGSIFSNLIRNIALNCNE